jgi:putative phage-type endonuclease
MTATVVLKRPPTTPWLRANWLARRRKGLTATDIPALFGLSPWRTPLDVWLSKLRPEGEEFAYRYEKGHALEGPLAAEWARRTGDIIETPPALLAHPDHPLILASLDRIAHAPDTTRLLELKTSYDWQEWADGAVPDLYSSQVLVQLAVTGLDEAVIFADVAGRLETRRIARDLAWEREAIDFAHAWWDDYIITGTPPPLDEIRDYPKLSRVWQPEPGTEIEATDAVMGAVKDYHALRERAKEREHTMTGLKTQIRAYMGTATLLRDPDTWHKAASITASGSLLVAAPQREEGTA